MDKGGLLTGQNVLLVWCSPYEWGRLLLHGDILFRQLRNPRFVSNLVFIPHTKFKWLLLGDVPACVRLC